MRESTPPKQLAQQRVWLNWELKERGGAKPAKVPYYADGSPRRGQLDSPADLARLVTYAEAAKAAKKHQRRVGLAVTPGLAFIDLDGHAPGGEPDEFAARWIAACPGAVVEVSQSGKGLHLIAPYSGPPATVADKAAGLEVYTGGRFCAWTGAIIVRPKRWQDIGPGLASLLPAPRRARQRDDRFSGERWDERNTVAAVERLRLRDPGCSRDEWLKTLMAIHDGTHGDDDGLDLALAWSSGELWSGAPPANYGGERDVRVVWGSIRPGRGVTKASLFASPSGAHAAPAAKIPVTPTAPFRGTVNGAGKDISELFRMQLPPRVWRVQQMLTAGAYLLVARPKCGKSYLCLQLAKSLVLGVPFMDHQTHPCRVAYFAAEDDDRRLAERIVATKTPPGITGITFYSRDDIVGLAKSWHARDDEARGASEADDWLRAWCAEHDDVGLILIDTQESFEAIFRLEAPAEAERSVTRDTYRRMRLYDSLALDTNKTIVLVNHTRKRNGKEITDFHELINMSQTAVAGVSGSIVLADHPDRDAYDEDQRRVLAIRGRDIDSDLTLSLERLQDGSGFKSEGSYRRVEQTKAQAELLACVEALQGGDKAVTVAMLAAELGKHRNTVQGLLARLRQSGTTKWKNRTVEVSRGPGGGVRLV